MLACDLVVEVRASRSLSGEQISKLERMIFSGGRPSREQLDLLLLLDTYLERSDPSWGELLTRAALSAHSMMQGKASPVVMKGAA